MSKSLQDYQERLNDRVRPVLNHVYQHLAEVGQDLDLAVVLGNALKGWECIDREFSFDD
jgi:hypothetical protein